MVCIYSRPGSSLDWIQTGFFKWQNCDTITGRRIELEPHEELVSLHRTQSLKGLPLISTQRKRDSWPAALSSGATSAGRTVCRCWLTAQHRGSSLETVNPRRYSFWHASLYHSQSESWRMEIHLKVLKVRRGTALWAPLVLGSWCVKSVSQTSAPETHLCPQLPLQKTVRHLLPLSRCHNFLWWQGPGSGFGVASVWSWLWKQEMNRRRRCWEVHERQTCLRILDFTSALLNASL